MTKPNKNELVELLKKFENCVVGYYKDGEFLRLNQAHTAILDLMMRQVPNVPAVTVKGIKYNDMNIIFDWCRKLTIQNLQKLRLGRQR